MTTNLTPLEALNKLNEIKKKLLELGAAGALMSGSGPAVFGVFADRKQLEPACDALGKNSNWRLYVVEMLT